MMRLPGSVPAPSGPTYKPRYPNTPGPRPGTLGGLGAPQMPPAMPAPPMTPNPGVSAPVQPVMAPAAPQTPAAVPVGAAEARNPAAMLNRRPGMMGLALRRQAV